MQRDLRQKYIYIVRYYSLAGTGIDMARQLVHGDLFLKSQQPVCRLPFVVWLYTHCNLPSNSANTAALPGHHSRTFLFGVS